MPFQQTKGNKVPPHTHIHVEPFLFFRPCPSNILSLALVKSVVIWCKAREKSLLRANPCWFNIMDGANSHWINNCMDGARFWIDGRLFFGITGCRTNGFWVQWNFSLLNATIYCIYIACQKLQQKLTFKQLSHPPPILRSFLSEVLPFLPTRRCDYEQQQLACSQQHMLFSAVRQHYIQKGLGEWSGGEKCLHISFSLPRPLMYSVCI